MADCCETVTKTVRYFLEVSIDGASGTQKWGPFCSRVSAEAVVPALASRANVQKVVILQEEV